MERYVVIDNYCGWPKLTLMPDGSLLMNVHNRPSHGSWDGYAECWRSTDGGRSFSYVGRPVEPVKDHPHVDRAAGLAHNGDYIAVSDDRGLYCHDAIICRSSDGGQTFTTVTEHYAIPGKDNVVVEPYGSVIQIPGNKLAFSCWAPHDPATYKGFGVSNHDAYFCLSEDDGATWNEPILIATGINETAILFYDETNGIAIGRVDHMQGNSEAYSVTGGAGNKVYRTADGGKTWQYESHLFGIGIIPTHLCRTATGETVVTAGFRFANRQGVLAALSRDDGHTFEDPVVLVEYPASDSGYPSTVQMPDGTMVTAYYNRGNYYHTRYHVGTVLWSLDDFLLGSWKGPGPSKVRYQSGEEYENRWELM